MPSSIVKRTSLVTRAVGDCADAVAIVSITPAEIRASHSFFTGALRTPRRFDSSSFSRAADLAGRWKGRQGPPVVDAARPPATSLSGLRRPRGWTQAAGRSSDVYLTRHA